MSDTEAPGWQAIDDALASVYADQQPQHFGTLIKWRLGGNDPIDGISVYSRTDPLPHWHYVTYGFSELYDSEPNEGSASGYGFELTFRLLRPLDQTDPPMWPMGLLQNLARYVFGTGNVFRHGEWMPANGPIAADQTTVLESLAFVSDPELPALDTAQGTVSFLQVVGLTKDEEQAMKAWSVTDFLDTVQPRMPLWITDLDRGSTLQDPALADLVNQGSLRDGSSTGSLFVERLDHRLVDQPGGQQFQVELSAAQVPELMLLLPRRLPFGKPLRLVGQEASVRFCATAQNQLSLDEDQTLQFGLTQPAFSSLMQQLRPEPGSYTIDGFAAVRFIVT